MTPDRIQKSILLHAPLERVWNAITDSAQFGKWFGAAIDGPFTPGQAVSARIAPTTVDPEVAKLQKPHEGIPFAFTVDRIEPHRLFSFRWHPFALEKNRDYSNEPSTLIEFTLEQKADGVLLTITESGFDLIPLDRRAQAFKANEGGWEKQLTLIQGYLAQHAH